ncbi:MAG: tRNA glutamyl-Q(34) synthetase GluQRS [Hyphomicrobiaceae bacterium]
MPSTSSPILRFAPSPNGPLHLGHALSALTGLAWARRLGGRFLVRIEDIDLERSSEAHIEGIFRDLAWLGVPWEEPVLRQSHHFPRYEAAAERLARLGLLYPCFASRREIAEASAGEGAPRDPDGAPRYPGLHRGLPAAEAAARRQRGEPYVMRLDMGRALKFATERLGGAPLDFTELDENGAPQRILCDPARWGDIVIQRKDVPTSYHLAVVVDDAYQKITHVTRGRDLFAATGIHRLLQVLLDLPAPLYAHHRLIVDESGRKLAKSARDTSLADLRAAGATPADIRGMIGLG